MANQTYENECYYSKYYTMMKRKYARRIKTVVLNPITPGKREKCEGCRIAVPGVEESQLTTYRGHKICYWCIARWKKEDKRAGKETTWEEFSKPIPAGIRTEEQTPTALIRKPKRKYVRRKLLSQ